MCDFLNKKERGQWPFVASASRECEQRCGLRAHAVKARLVRYPLQRPGDLGVPVPCKIFIKFGVQLGQLSRCPPPRPT